VATRLARFNTAMESQRSSILSELRTPDEATLAFNSFGLGGRLESEDAAEFQAATIARAVLADNVPEDVRNNFDRARKLHLYGVLEYEFFTAAGDYALLVLEGASGSGSSPSTATASHWCTERPRKCCLRRRSRTYSKHAAHGCAELTARPTGCP
jgi:hypothetical protein